MVTRVYRLAVTLPEGSDAPGWEPPGWEPDDYRITSGPDAGAWDSHPFRWPANRLCLSPGTAKRRAAIFRKYGATVVIEASEPVTWPSGGAQ
jgi:hypothetical protein